MLFSPLEFDGRDCTDGGVAHEVPVDPWLNDDGIDHIIMHRITQPAGKPPLLLPGKLAATIAASHEFMGRQILADRMTLARLHGKKISVATTTHPRPSPLFPSRLKSGYAMGEATAQQLFDDELAALLV
jgi:predicted acylesterase/phospholipase RssA